MVGDFIWLIVIKKFMPLLNKVNEYIKIWEGNKMLKDKGLSYNKNKSKFEPPYKPKQRGN